nr:hypothetical protein [Tanacetum cinerariifolium]
MPPKKNGMSAAAIEQLIEQRVTEALAAQENNRNSENPYNSNSNSIGNKGAVGLAYLFEKMESVFRISNCTIECQVNYATCALLGSALTWWNSHLRNVGHVAAYGMPWKTLKNMVPDESDKVEKYVGGLLDNIQGNVMSARPKMLQEAIDECPELKNQNHENQAGNSEARGMVYAMGGGEADHYPNNIVDDTDA